MPQERNKTIANFLVFCVEQYASDQVYPYLEQQQRILSQIVEQVETDFPLLPGEHILYHRRPNCGAEYIGIALRGETPTEEQITYLRDVRPHAYLEHEESVAPRVVSYEVIGSRLFRERRDQDYYYWEHDRSQEIALQPVEAEEKRQ